MAPAPAPAMAMAMAMADATGGETLVRALRLPCVRGVHTARGFASVSTNRRARIRRPMRDGFKRISRRGSRKSA
ncbi:hypothetical protein Y026_4194 [Burkholderia pseudomallei TSV28]|nr:hypothetical protein Y026_4194 [Burkholderia pseudomallei TSV28]